MATPIIAQTATVPSFTRQGIAYQTALTSCTCPDATYRQSRCKHQVEVFRAMVARRAEIIRQMDAFVATIPQTCDSRYYPEVARLWELRCQIDEELEAAGY